MAIKRPRETSESSKQPDVFDVYAAGIAGEMIPILADLTKKDGNDLREYINQLFQDFFEKFPKVFNVITIQIRGLYDGFERNVENILKKINDPSVEYGMDDLVKILQGQLAIWLRANQGAFTVLNLLVTGETDAKQIMEVLGASVRAPKFKPESWEGAPREEDVDPFGTAIALGFKQGNESVLRKAPGDPPRTNATVEKVLESILASYRYTDRWSELAEFLETDKVGMNRKLIPELTQLLVEKGKGPIGMVVKDYVKPEFQIGDGVRREIEGSTGIKLIEASEDKE